MNWFSSSRSSQTPERRAKMFHASAAKYIMEFLCTRLILLQGKATKTEKRNKKKREKKLPKMRLELKTISLAFSVCPIARTEKRINGFS
jgi:hypothetical protein